MRSAAFFAGKSAILWGSYQEITDPEKKHQAMQGIVHRLMPFATSPSADPSHGITSNEADLQHKIDLIVYQITITEKTGRFEISDSI